MNDHFPPKPTRPGERFSYDRAIREAGRRGRSGASAFTRVSDTTAGVFVNAVPVAPSEGVSSTPVQQFLITGILGDYLQCVTYDGETLGTTDVLVAKPLHLRRSTWHGVTRDGATYTATTADGQARSMGITQNGQSGEGVENLIPSYAHSETIKAFQPEGGTGLTVAGQGPIIWEDCNNDARRFVFPYQIRRVCINGAWRFVVRRESEPFGDAS